MVLGDGTFQQGLIRDLLRQGMDVHVVSKWPARQEPVGYTRHLLDYCDTARVTALFSHLGCDFILTAASEAALFTAGRINTQFGLPGGLDEKLVLFFEDKLHYKRVLAEAGVNIPAFEVVKNKKDLEAFRSKHSPAQVMLKKRRGSGSADLIHLPHENAALPEGFAFSDFFAEVFIAGREYGGDMIVLDGSVVFYWPTLKSVTGSFVPYMHLLLRGSAEIQVMLTSYLRQVVEVLGLRDGIFNVDIIVDRDKPWLIDMSPRIGGNCIPDIILPGCGVNEWRVLADLHRGCRPVVEPQAMVQPHGVYIIHATHRGVVHALTPMSAEGIVEVYYAKQPGEEVYLFSEGRYHVGYVIFTASTDEALQALAGMISAHRWFSLEA